MSRKVSALVIVLVLGVLAVVVFRATDQSSEGLLRALPKSITARLGIDAPVTNTCPVCLQSSTFTAAGSTSRDLALCVVCGSLERHRLLMLYLRQRTNLFRDQLSVLHFSPERGLGGELARQKNLKYATSWYEPDRAADFHLDLTALALPDNSWDVFLVYHIFEHITEDRKAMRELFRALKPGGWAVVQVPTDERTETLEDPSINTAEEKLARYGDADHVRFYGWKDFADRLTGAGFQVTIERFARELTDQQVREFALDRNERIYMVRKPK
jgi:predicted SAM-dependent methyltransferase